jgi:hypothetical protein
MKPIYSKHFLTLLLLLLAVNGIGQPAFFKSFSFDEALKNAVSSKQLVFVQMNSNCDECNTVAFNGLNGEGVAEIYKNFICIQVEPDSEVFKELCKRFRISPNYPTSLFLTAEGDFICMMYNKSTSNSMEYIQLSANAMANQKNPPLKAANQKYTSGNYNSEFLKSYLLLLQQYNLDNEDVLENFTGRLTIDSLFSKNNLLVLIKCAPLIDSKTDKLMRFDSKLFNETFMSLSLQERIRINSLIIAKSRQKAYSEKNEDYMYKVANFISGTHQNNKEGRLAFSINFLNFYKEMKDTANYIERATGFYRWNYEGLNLDSIAQVELNKTVEIAPGKFIKGGSLLATGEQINNMAWTIYEYTSDLEMLAKILKWSERTLVYEHPPFHDTYAHILYKIGNKDKAVEYQQKAIDLAKQKHFPEKELVEELNKMKVGTL